MRIKDWEARYDLNYQKKVEKAKIQNASIKQLFLILLVFIIEKINLLGEISLRED